MLTFSQCLDEGFPGIYNRKQKPDRIPFGKLLLSHKKRCHCEERSDVAIPRIFRPAPILPPKLSSRASAASRRIYALNEAEM